jgi:hypothetical protein
MSKAEITTHDTSEEPDGAQLTVEQLEAVAAGYEIRDAGRGFEVYDDNGRFVNSFRSEADAVAWCNGARAGNTG